MVTLEVFDALVGAGGAGIASDLAADELGAGLDAAVDAGTDGDAEGLDGFDAGFADGAGCSVAFAGLESAEW
jgi:hypothetical protein